MASDKTRPKPAACPFLGQFTTAEMEVLGLLAQGYTNPAIAETLCTDINTVEQQLDSMYRKVSQGKAAISLKGSR